MNKSDFQPRNSQQRMELTDGSRVAVMGGGPAGSFFSYFLLDMSARAGLNVDVDIFEPKDFSVHGPKGCNHCGGIISESLVQALATDGINLPPSVIQRGIEAYILHMDVGDARIDTPVHEKRIGAVFRGSGPPIGLTDDARSFDGFLQGLAKERGARVIRDHVDAVTWREGRPEVKPRHGDASVYDLLVVAIGINSPALKIFGVEPFDYHPPRTAKTFIREFELPASVMDRAIGDAMHLFLLDVPGLEFAAIIPKGPVISLCMLGEGLDRKIVDEFLESAEVKGWRPGEWQTDCAACQCAPKIATHGAPRPYGDRLLFVGDSGVTRLYKDGIGAAYRTAKAAASAAVFQGLAAADFRRHYAPACRRLERDNVYGRIMFLVTKVFQKIRWTRRAMRYMVNVEQRMEGRQRRMSMVLWDMFTGSAPYREIFYRTLHPVFLLRFAWSFGACLFDRSRVASAEPVTDHQAP